jgi:hypothetical protein
MERRAHGFLKCVGTKDSDRTIELRGTEFTIGRRETCDVSYSDTMLSAVHCKLVYFEHHPKQDDSWWLEDCSSNGTYLNGTLVGKGTLRCLERGDSISLLLPKPGAAELPRYSYTFARLPSSEDAQRAGMFSEASVNLKVEDAVKRAVLLADVERKKAIADAVERTKQEHEHERRTLLEKAAATATETERALLARAQAQAQAASREHALALETALASADEKATQRFMAALSAVREQARGDSAAMLEAHEREAEAHRLAMSQMEERLATSEAEVSRMREAQAAAVEAALAEQRERLETIAQEACASMRADLDDEKAAAVTRAVSSARTLSTPADAAGCCTRSSACRSCASSCATCDRSCATCACRKSISRSGTRAAATTACGGAAACSARSWTANASDVRLSSPGCAGRQLSTAVRSFKHSSSSTSHRFSAARRSAIERCGFPLRATVVMPASRDVMPASRGIPRFEGVDKSLQLLASELSSVSIRGVAIARGV